MTDAYQEHCDFNYSTASEWDRAEASELGAANPDQAWILTDRDAWHANPYYEGPEVPHPEDHSYEEEDDGQPDEAQEWHDFDPDC